jgi:hypothetical protein
MNDDSEDNGMMPFDDNDEDQAPPSGANRRSSIRFSVSNDDSSANLNISGLDVSHNTDESASRKRSSTIPPSKKKRKRRKCVTDFGHAELSNAAMKDMFDDTSSIVRQNIVHPATVVPKKRPVSLLAKNRALLVQHLEYERMMTRPTLGDNGQLAPELLALWKRTTAEFRLEPFDFEMAPRETARNAASLEEESNSADESQFPVEENDMEEQFEQEEDDAPPIAFDDEEEENMPPPQMNDDEENNMNYSGASNSTFIMFCAPCLDDFELVIFLYLHSLHPYVCFYFSLFHRPRER